MKRNRFYLYLLINVIVSAVTTLVVLLVWDSTHKVQLPAAQPVVLAEISPMPATMTAAPSAETAGAGMATPTHTPPAPEVAGTLPPPSTPLINIEAVIGVGDLPNEVVMLKRVGTGNISMTGWKLTGQHGSSFTFPPQPELILYKDGAVQIFSKAGTDTVTEVYMNRDQPAWRAGETLKLLDPQGNERATYQIP